MSAIPVAIIDSHFDFAEFPSALTAEGAALYEVTRAGFGAIAEVVTRVREGSGATRITLSSTAAFLGHVRVSRGIVSEAARTIRQHC